jgi:N-acetylmuramoyl-L-alanine amidase
VSDGLAATAGAHRTPRLGFAAIIVAVAWGCMTSAAVAHQARHAAATIRALGLETSAQGATLTVELSRVTGYKLFSLDNPHRIVLDLKTTERARSAHLPRAAGMVAAVRAGARPQGVLRLVLQLKVAAPAQARWISSGAAGARRLVIDVGTQPAVASATHARQAAAPVSAPAAAPQAELPVRAAHAPLNTGRDVVIAVDPGHGGKDSGAIGHDGTEEKNVVLGIALALSDRINAEPGMRAVLTRDRDEFLPLGERWSRARDARADLFVSVHADSIRDSHVSGSSVYVLSERGETDEAARWLADRENAAALMGGVSLADKDSRLQSVLLDLAQAASISASMTAAERVLASLREVGAVRKPQVQQAGFVVLKAPDVPSMLIETAYISNPGDERRLRTPSEQRRLADAIFSGLLAYFEQHPPVGTRFAREQAGGAASAVLAGTALAPPATVGR